MRTGTALLALVLWAVPALAAEVTGTVVDPTGAPVAGSRVWVTGSVVRDEAIEQYERSATTDETGRFVCEVPDPGSEPRPAIVLAYAPGRALATACVETAGEPATITLLAPAPRGGRVTGPDGQPIAGVAVRLAALESPVHGDGWSLVGQTPLPKDGFPEARAVTDADGRYSLACLPPDANARVEFRSERFGCATISSSNGWDLAIEGIGALRVRLTGEGAGRLAGCPVGAMALRDAPSPEFRAEGVMGADGTFDAGPVAAGSYMVWVGGQPPEGPRVRTATVEVKPGDGTDALLPLVVLSTMRGRLVDAETGEGIAGGSVSVRTFEPQTGGAQTAATTAADGSFETRCFPGRRSLSAAGPKDGAPNTIAGWLPFRMGDSFEVGPTGVDLGAVRLHRGYRLRVRVVDQTGAPVAGARVASDGATVDGAITSSGATITSDADGLAVSDWLPPSTYRLSAREGLRATRAPTEVVLGPDTGPVTLVLEAGVLSLATVRVVDESGLGLAGISAELETHALGEETLEVEAGVQIPGTGLASGPDGTVTIAGLAPGKAYAVRVGARGVGHAMTEFWPAVGGQAHDLGTLVLPLRRGTIEGLVRDAAGQPLVGATVTAVDPGTTATTGSDGRFRLASVSDRPQVVVAQAEGHLLEGTVATPGTEVALVLPNAEEALCGEPVPFPRPAWDADEVTPQLVRLLVDALRQMATEGSRLGWDIAGLLGSLRMLDGSAATRVAEELGRELPPTHSASLPPPRAVMSLAEALGMLERQAEPGAQLAALVGASAQVIDVQPEAARRCLLAAAGIAGGMAGRSRAELVDYARLGEMLVRLGEPEGERLLRDAGAEADTLGSDYASVKARGQVGALLCALHVEAGLALIATVGNEQERGDCLCQAAGHAARSDPERALAVVEMLRGSAYQQRALLAVLPWLADRDPERAAQLAAGLGAGSQCAVVLARAACATDPGHRRWLLERAAAALDGPRAGTPSVSDSASLADLACLAHQLGYGQPRQLALRALLAWGSRTWRDDTLEHAAHLAEPLTLVAPDLAAPMVQELYSAPKGDQRAGAAEAVALPAERRERALLAGDPSQGGLARERPHPRLVPEGYW